MALAIKRVTNLWGQYTLFCEIGTLSKFVALDYGTK